jgi:hypothetical protein
MYIVYFLYFLIKFHVYRIKKSIMFVDYTFNPPKVLPNIMASTIKVITT